MGNIFPYCPAVGAIRKINSSSIDLPKKVYGGVVIEIVFIVTRLKKYDEI